MRTTVIATIIIGIFLMGNVTNSYAGDAYLQIKEIPGGVMEARHVGWLKIQSYSWGGSNPTSGSSGGARSAARAALTPLNLNMQLDGSFPKLALFMANGQQLPVVVLEELYPGTKGIKQPLLEIKLTNVKVVGIELGSTEEEAPIVSFGLDYGKIEWTYTVVDPRGKVKGDIKSEWDRMKNSGR